MDAAQHKSGNKRWIALAVAAIVLALAIFFSAGIFADARDRAQPAPTETLPIVELARAEPVDGLNVVEEGFIRPRAEIAVVPEIAGKVVEVAPQLEPGGRFAEGETLFRIDPTTFEADLARARADLEAARAELERARADAERQERLAEIGAAAQSQRQAASAALASARARIGQAEAARTTANKRLEDTYVRAPFDASVISESVALGGYVQPGMTAATIFDTGPAEIVLGLRPQDAAAVRRAAANREAPLTAIIVPSSASASTETLTGRVKSFGQSVDRRSRTVSVVIEVADAFGEDAAVFANDFVEVTLPAASDEQLFSAPLGIVRSESFVWTLDEENRLVKVSVTPLERTDERVTFSSEVDLTGARLVLTALTEEAEGVRVEIAGSSAREETMQ